MVTATLLPATLAADPRTIGKNPCGFCVTGHHGLCPAVIKNGSKAEVPTWTCPCVTAGHTLGGAHRTADIQRLPPRPLPAPGASAAAALGFSPAAANGASARRRQAGAKPAGFPPGVCSPYQFRGVLISKGLVTGDFRPQTVYGWVTKAQKHTSTFPVRYYTADGELADASADGARPGVPVDDAIAWFAAQQAA